ncbi:MAG: hypothetical protein ACRDTT_14650, partial [Pseudonocardiaceae bacterium]
ASRWADDHLVDPARESDPRDRPPSPTFEPGRSGHRSAPRPVERRETGAQPPAPPAASTSPNPASTVNHSRPRWNARNKHRPRTRKLTRGIAATVGLGALLLGLGYFLGFWAGTPDEIGVLSPTNQGPAPATKPDQLSVSAVTVNRVATRPGSVLQMLVRTGSVGPYKVQGPCTLAGEQWTCAPAVPPAALGPSSTVMVVDVDDAVARKLGDPGTEHTDLPAGVVEVARFTVG